MSCFSIRFKICITNIWQRRSTEVEESWTQRSVIQEVWLYMLKCVVNKMGGNNINCNRMRQIHPFAGIRLKSMCTPPVNTVPHDGPTENFWDHNYQTLDLELSVESTAVHCTTRFCRTEMPSAASASLHCGHPVPILSETYRCSFAHGAGYASCYHRKITNL